MEGEALEGKKARIDAAHRKQFDRAYLSLHGRVCYIIAWFDRDDVYVEFDNPVPVWNPRTQAYVLESFVSVHGDVLKPMFSEHLFLPGEVEDWL